MTIHTLIIDSASVAKVASGDLSNVNYGENLTAFPLDN